MAADILDLFDAGNTDTYDADMAPAPAPSYLNKKDAFDFDATISRAFFHRSRKDDSKVYMIFVAEFEGGTYIHSGAKNPKDGEQAEPGDEISLMFDLTKSKSSKFVIQEMSRVVDACVGAARPGEAGKMNSEFGVTAKSKAALIKAVGEDAAAYASVTSEGEFRVTGLARVLTSGLLDGSKINLHTTGQNGDWYKYSAKPITPANTMADIARALGVK